MSENHGDIRKAATPHTMRHSFATSMLEAGVDVLTISKFTSRHPTQRHRRKPFLVDNVELGRKFRKHFVDGLRRLVLGGKLRLEGEWFWLQDPTQLEAWLGEFSETDWNVFVEGPPHGESRPADVLKYLARYMTGGPISDRRLISDEDGVVTFWARSKDKGKGNRSEPFPLKGTEFVRRCPPQVTASTANHIPPPRKHSYTLAERTPLRNHNTQSTTGGHSFPCLFCRHALSRAHCVVWRNSPRPLQEKHPGVHALSRKG